MEAGSIDRLFLQLMLRVSGRISGDLGQGRVDEYHVEQIVECGMCLHGDNKEVDHVRGLRAEDVCAQNAA